MMRMSGNRRKVSSRLRTTPWGSRFRNAQTGCRTEGLGPAASLGRFRWRQGAWCRPGRNRATTPGVRFRVVHLCCSPARRCPTLPSGQLGRCTCRGRLEGLRHGGPVAANEEGESLRHLPKGCVFLVACSFVFGVVPALEPVGFQGLNQLSPFSVFEIALLDHLDGGAFSEDVGRPCLHSLRPKTPEPGWSCTPSTRPPPRTQQPPEPTGLDGWLSISRSGTCPSAYPNGGGFT